MLIRVLLPDKEEGLFNADCNVDQLLDAIKKKHQLPRSDIIDLSNTEGKVKELNNNGRKNGMEFFKLREMCLVVKVQYKDGSPCYTPALHEYAKNEQFMALLSHKDDVSCCVRVKLKNPSHLTTRAHTPERSVSPSKNKLSGAKNKKRRMSSSKHH